MRYKIGEKVTIRQWDDMEKQFGLNRIGNIDCHCVFIKDMDKYCGKTMTIRNFYVNYNYYEMENEPYYNWSEDMFEPPDTSIKYFIKKKGKL